MLAAKRPLLPSYVHVHSATLPRRVKHAQTHTRHGNPVNKEKGRKKKKTDSRQHVRWKAIWVEKKNALLIARSTDSFTSLNTYHIAHTCDHKGKGYSDAPSLAIHFSPSIVALPHLSLAFHRTLGPYRRRGASLAMCPPRTLNGCRVLVASGRHKLQKRL